MGKVSKDSRKAGKTANKKKAKLDAVQRRADLLKARGQNIQSDDDSDSDDDTTPYKRVKPNPAPITPPNPAPITLPTTKVPTTKVKIVTGQVTEYVKTYLFRHTKFIQDNDEVDSACEKIWNELHKANHWKDTYNLTLARFIKLYGAIIMKALTAARQYCQSKGKNAAQCKYFCCLLRLTGCFYA